MRASLRLPQRLRTKHSRSSERRFKNGTVTKHRPFDVYTIKQAIQEGFILDVLQAYTPVQSYYKLIKRWRTIRRSSTPPKRSCDGTSKAMTMRSRRRPRSWWITSTIGDRPTKIGGQARAMVVCRGIQRAIQYFHAFQDYLKERKSPYRAIVAFSGEHEYGGKKVTEHR